MRSSIRNEKYQRLLLVLVWVLALSGCKQEGKHQNATEPSPRPAVEVRVMTVGETQVGSQNEIVGTVEAVQRATIAAKVTGTIAEMPVVLGSTVKEGDLLVKVNAAEIAARLSQAETALSQAKRNLDRESRLLSKNAATQESVNAQQDAYKMAKAALNEARTMQGYSIIRAPFSGMVSSKLANAGDLATVGAPLLVLEEIGHLQVVAAVPESQLAAIKTGDILPLRVPAINLETTGAVAEIAPAADAASRTSIVKFDLEPLATVRPGQFVRVILPGLTARALMVPGEAVSVFGQMERLFVVEKGSAHLRLIRSGQRRQGQVEIMSGLNVGEQVVIQGSEQLSDGQAVLVAP